MVREGLVSILIPVYNAEKWLVQTIESAISQSYSHREIIIVDDGSTDQSFQIAKGFENDFIKVLRQVNNGASAARNRAFKQSKGEFIQYLDSDDILAPDKIEKQVKLLKRMYPRAISSGYYYNFRGDVSNKYPEPNIVHKSYKNPFQWLIDAARGKTMYPPVAWLIPRILVEEAGPWNETLSYNDDPEFIARVILKSSEIVYCKDSVCYYRRGNSSSLGSRKDDKALESRLESLILVTDYMLNFKDDLETREALALQYRRFIFSIYPYRKDLKLKAEEILTKLNVKGSFNFGKGVSSKISKIIGWKNTKLLKYYWSQLINKLRM